MKGRKALFQRSMSEKNHERPVTISAVSICFSIFGVMWFAFLVLVLVVSGVHLEDLNITSRVLSLLSILIGVTDIAVGYGLWKMRRWAAILGMLLSVMGIMIANTFGGLTLNSMYWHPPLQPNEFSVALAYFSTACMYVYILFFVSIAISWKSFQTQTA